MENAARTSEATRRQINLNTCEVWCPFYEEDVKVYDQCIGDPTVGRDACPFKVDIWMGGVFCSYDEEDLDCI